jgi:polyphosphate kinase
MTSGSSYHVIELSLVHNGTTVYLSQYGEIFTDSSLGTFDASITGSTLSLFLTAANSITTVKLIRDTINI